MEDEIGQLADTFNVMAERLRSAFAQVEYERDRVEVLLNDLSEGVVGVSADGKVTIANPAAVDPAGRADGRGRDRSTTRFPRTSPSCGATRSRTPTST